MAVNSAVKELVIILEYYMDYYGLYSIDITKLLKSTRDIMKELKESKNGPTLKKLDAIAGIFGLKYYQFGDPEYTLPEYESLPPATREKIDWRKEVGPPESRNYKKLDLNNAVLNVLQNFVSRKEFLPSEVYESLSSDLKSELGSATRVTGLFSDELKEYVKKTGNSIKKKNVGRPEEFYTVVSLKPLHNKTKPRKL